MIVRRVSGGNGPIDTEHDKSMRKLYPELEELWKLKNEAAALAEYLCTRYCGRMTHFLPKTKKKRRLFGRACNRRERRDQTYRVTLKMMWIPIKPTPPPTRLISEWSGG